MEFACVVRAAVLGIFVSALGAAPSAKATSFQTIFAFNDRIDDAPWGGLNIGPGRALYVTNSSNGPPYYSGTAFEVLPPATAAGAWTRKLLHTFTGGTDGDNPLAPPVRAPSGMLYGTANEGGSTGTYGVIYQVDPKVGPSSYRVIWNFQNGQDGGFPWAPLIVAPGGVLYGTTTTAYATSGTVFALLPPAAGRPGSKMTILHGFTGKDGDMGASGAPLYRNPKTGALFGVTNRGGLNDNGVVFELVPPAGAGKPWTYHLLHAFTGKGDGANPVGGLSADAKGYIYGTTSYAGAGHDGTVFRLVGSDKKWTFQTLFAFGALTSPKGTTPYCNLLIDTAGRIYGATLEGGKNDHGVIFKLTPPTTAVPRWTETVLHTFAFADGVTPRGQIVWGSDHAIYGTTFSAGPKLGGTVYRLVP